MLRNKTLSALQKTYDDSYLSCSTAVYYESQGDEPEAMRHWRSALGQIYEYNATKAPPAYAPQTDTERALHDALKELELQCKERIDLLEALRVSRQADLKAAAAGSGTLSKTPELPAPDLPPRTKGSIGQGTIPAVTYSQLSRPSRPSLPYRPSLQSRTSSEFAVVGGGAPKASAGASASYDSAPSGSSTPKPHSPGSAQRSDKQGRSASPEKHTMRTTLRSGRSGEKPVRVPRKPAKPVAEGSSKAATLAWSALGPRERLLRPVPPDGNPMIPQTSRRQSSDQPGKLASSQPQWDSNSRRLVPPRNHESATNGSQSSTTPRHSDEYPYSRPSLLSVSAASSALSSSPFQDPPTPEATVTRSERNAMSRSTPALTPPSKNGINEPLPSHLGVADDSGDASGSKNHVDAHVKRRPLARQPAGASRSPRPERGPGDRPRRQERQPLQPEPTSSNSDNDVGTTANKPKRTRRKAGNLKADMLKTEPVQTDSQDQSSEGSSQPEESSADQAWKKKQAAILKNLPAGVDESAAKQILNDIIVQGDEVRWGDIAGLEIAKNALRETVVYPFLRPDLFMGLREPARGMLLFGPPGTGKTMLARAVATESNSTFFSISASSLTSKYLGESEKLVRALFGLARALAPSIIFVDEIDSLLSQRAGSGEHEATRRIKTEFLIQWSDLQRAAAGRETTERDRERGDANRVLVLAATNLPWAIDEAARRRFVRRQYIPLPEHATRETQLRTLLGQQKHNLSNEDIYQLTELTDGFSGSDITALAKDAAMGPLRSLGEALLHMTMEDIRPIMLIDFQASLGTIRPSVSKAGLKEYEDWAKEFGERGG